MNLDFTTEELANMSNEELNLVLKLILEKQEEQDEQS